MATQSLSLTASLTLTLLDNSDNVVFTYSPTFTVNSGTTDRNALTTGELLVATGGTQANLAAHNKDLIYTFIKNVDSDYSVAVNPDGDTIADLKPNECMFSPIHVDGAGDGSANLDLAATTAAQKVQFLICDGEDSGISSDD
jgi:hypothetical protein